MMGTMPMNTSDKDQVAYGGFGRHMLHGCINPSQTGHFRHTAKLVIQGVPNPKTQIFVSRLVFQLYVPNRLKPGVKWRMPMYLEQFYCLLRCVY